MNREDIQRTADEAVAATKPAAARAMRGDEPLPGDDVIFKIAGAAAAIARENR